MTPKKNTTRRLGEVLLLLMTSFELEGIEDVLIHNKILEARAEEIQQSKAKLEEETGFLKHQIRIRDKKLDTAAANVAKLEGTIVQLKKHLEEKEKALQHHKLSKNELLNKIDALTEENLRLRSDLELYRTAVGTPSPSSLLANATSGAANGNVLSRTNSSLVPGTSQTLWRSGSTTSLLHAPASSANMSKKDQFAQLMEHKVLCVVLRRRLREARQRHMDIMAKGEAMAMEVEDQRSYINDLIAKNGGNGVINLKTLARRTSSGMPNDNEGGELTPEDEAQLDAYYKSTNRPRIFGSKVGHGGDFYYGPHSNFPAQTLELQTRAEEDFIESKFKQSAYGDALKNMAGEMEAIARRAKETHDKQQNALWHVFTEATRRGGSLLANPKQDYLSNLAVGLREYNMTMGNLMRIFRENAAKLMNSERNVREVLEKSIRAEIAAGKIHVGTQADIESPEMTVMTERIAYMEERQREVSAKHNKEVAALEDSRRKAEINTQFLQSKIFELHESVYEALSAVHRHRFQWVASVPNVFADIIAIANKQAAATSTNDDINSSPTKRGYGHRHHAHTKNNSNKSVQFNLRVGHAIDEERSLLAKFAHYFLSSELFGTVNTASANLQKNSTGSSSNPFMFTYSAVNDASVTGDVGAVNPLSSTAFSNATNAMMMAMLGGGGGTSSRASSPRGSRVTPTMRGGSDNKREEKDDGFIEFQKNAKAKSRMTGQKELAKSTFEELQKILKKEKKQEVTDETTRETGRNSRGRSGSTTKKEGKVKPQQGNSSTPLIAPLSKGSTSKGSFVRSNSTSFASSSLLSPATKGGNSRTSTPPPPPPAPALLQNHAQHAVDSRPVHAPRLNKDEENERIAQSSNQATPTNNKASEGGVAESRRAEAGEVGGGVIGQSLSFMGRRHNIASAFSSRVASGTAIYQSQTRRGQQEEGMEKEDDGGSYTYRRVTSTGDDEDVSVGLWSAERTRRGGQHAYNDEPIEGIKRADSFFDSNLGDAASLRARVGDTSKSHTCMSDMRSNNKRRDTLGGVLTPCCLSPTVSPMSSALAPPPPPPQKAEIRGDERPATSNKQHVSGGSFRNAVMVRHNSSSSTPASNATTPTATPTIVPSAPSSRRPSPSRTNSILTKNQHSLYHHHSHQGSTLAQLTIVTCTTEEEGEANNAGRIGGATTGRRDSTLNNVHSNANTVSLMLSPKAPAPATARQPGLFTEENTIATTGDIAPPAPRRRASAFTSATTTVTSSVSTFTTDTATATSKDSRRDSDGKVRHPEGSKEVKSNGKNSVGKIDHDNGDDDDHNSMIFDFPLPSSSSEALVNANVGRRRSVQDFVCVTGTNVRDRSCVSDGDEKENDDDIFGRMVSSVSMNPLISGEAPKTTAAKASFSSTQPTLTRMLTWQKQQQENWERKRRWSDAATAATTTPTIIFTTNAALSSALYNNGGNSSTAAHKKPSSKGNNSNSVLNKENGGVGGTTVSMVDASRWVGGLSRSQSYTNSCGLGAANAGFARTYSSSPSSNHPVAAPNVSSSCSTAASLLPIITNNNSQTAGKPLASRRTNPTAK